MIVQELQNFVAYLDRRIMQDKLWLEMFTKFGKELEPISGLISMFHTLFFCQLVNLCIISNSLLRSYQLCYIFSPRVHWNMVFCIFLLKLSSWPLIN